MDTVVCIGETVLVFTINDAMDTLKRFDIAPDTLADWEQELGLSIPTNAQGHKQYSQLHINLFKNVRKHLALGRSLSEIKRIVTLPATMSSIPASLVQPETVNYTVIAGELVDDAVSSPVPMSFKAHADLPPVITASVEQVNPIILPATPNTVYSSVSRQASIAPSADIASRPVTEPSSSARSKTTAGTHASMVQLMDRLISEKDQLNKKLLDIEKLNSHLYNANGMFHRKVKDMSTETEALRQRVIQLETDTGALQYLDDKAKIQQQLLNHDRILQQARKQLVQKDQDITRLTTELNTLQHRMGQASSNQLSSEWFCANWNESAQLVTVEYDNFGINIEQERNRVFRISQAPQRSYGTTVIIETVYEYDSNSSWRRIETMILTPVPGQLATDPTENTPKQVTGELLVDYQLDGVPVAKARYAIACVQVV
jgi:DNA-binding transcriptional MerR regulator